MLRRTFIASAIAALWAVAAPAFAGVSAEEAAALKGALTPLGAEKAGNAAGTVPAWEGGMAKAPAGWNSGDPRPDPFAGEKPVFQITGKNIDQYKDKLSDGTQAMLRKYPGYRLDVYPTHRTAAAPQYVYDNTFTNATRAKTANGGNTIENAYGGTPFPIPKSGAEVMWNHLQRWRGGEAIDTDHDVWVVGTDGKPVLAVQTVNNHQFPYYAKDGHGLEEYQGDYFLLRQGQTAPPFKAGEALLIRDPLDQIGKGRRAWQYLAGQRRVRRAPTVAFDTPDFVASGQNYFDEVFNFFGSLERYDWKLLGKKEVYIPYNNNRMLLGKAQDAMSANHMDPDKLRWELHRVWVVEAQLLPGKRHVMPKKMFYLDEDTWAVVMMDGYDAQGQLWRTQHGIPYLCPDMPVVNTELSAVFNLLAGTWVLSAYPTPGMPTYRTAKARPDVYFSPDALAGGGVR